MRRLGLALLALGLSAAPAFAQNQGQLGQLQAEIGPNGGLKVECVGAGCGGVATGPSVDIVSVAGVPIVGGDLPVKFATPQAVTLSSVPSHPVTNAGTFAVQCTSGCSAGTPGQTTMANSSPVVIASDQSAVPVSGTFWPATQPVSGTFWQLTQPVSLASVPSHDVTNAGTFAVQATLAAETTKVIGAVNQGTSPWTVNLITGFALSATQTDRTQKTQLTDGTRDGTVKAASTLPALTDTAVVTTQRDPLPAGNNVVGKFSIDQATPGTTNRVDVGTMANVAVAMNTGVRAAGVQRVTIATDDIVPASQSGIWTVQPGNTANTTAWLVNGPALTKGTQGAVGYTIQELKDAGRTLVTLTAERVVPVLTTDTVVTCAKLVGDTATAGVTTYAVTSGKTLRLQAIHISLTPSSTTLGVVQVRLRTLSSGACTVAAGLKVMQWEIGNPGTGTQVANAANQRLDAFFPDGVEFSGATRNICLSMNALAAAAQVVTISLVGYEY